MLAQANVGGAGPLVAALGVEADLRSLGQGLAVGYGALMDEEVGGAVLGVMKPKPFSSLNHFTVPLVM